MRRKYIIIVKNFNVFFLKTLDKVYILVYILIEEENNEAKRNYSGKKKG